MKSSLEDSFHELYHAYFADLYRYVSQTVRNKADVEDVVQDVFLQAYRNFASFRGECSYKTWLFAIAHNQINSMWRKLFRRKQIFEQYEQNVRSEAQSDGEEEFDRLLLMQQLTAALQQLSDTYREVVALRYLHEFSVADTAVILYTSDARVRILTHRALLKLRTIWEQGGETVCRKIDSSYLNH